MQKPTPEPEPRATRTLETSFTFPCRMFFILAFSGLFLLFCLRIPGTASEVPV
jgi:hypothetical protein